MSIKSLSEEWQGKTGKPLPKDFKQNQEAITKGWQGKTEKTLPKIPYVWSEFSCHNYPATCRTLHQNLQL